MSTVIGGKPLPNIFRMYCKVSDLCDRVDVLCYFAEDIPPGQWWMQLILEFRLCPAEISRVLFGSHE